LRTPFRLPLTIPSLAAAAFLPYYTVGTCNDFTQELQPFFDRHCYECHDEQSEKGGLSLETLSSDLSDEATLSKWVRIYDRVASGEMPPKENEAPGDGEIRIFRDELAPPLSAAHEAQKETILRRLNRNEYSNTLNDLLGIQIDFASSLPEDGRSGEFDTIGRSLGISMSQMANYLESATRALDATIAKSTSPPAATKITASYAETQGAEKFVGEAWHKAPDGAIVFFRELGYPTGMLREASAHQNGRYRIKVTGYAYQSDKPVLFSVGSTTFARGAKRPTFGYFSFPPGEPSTVELTAEMDDRAMIEITPQGLYDPEYLIKKDGIANYKGPGLAISSVEIEGPLVDVFPSKGHDLIFTGLDRREIEPSNPKHKEKKYYVPKFEIISENPVKDVLPVLKRFASHAFRRPVTDEDTAPFLILFQKEMTEGVSFEDALRTALTAILCAPDFLYLREPTKGAGTLSDFAIASRLSYFLTRTAPDTLLLSAATRGDLLTDPSHLPKEAERLMNDPRFARFLGDFTDSWLDLRSLEFTNPDETLFPEFDRYLQHSMLEETRAYFRELITENLSIDHFVKSDFAMLNWRLAKHYGIDGVDSASVEKVALPSDSPRGGLLSQAGILKVSANGTNTSPVLRGVWINERILGKHPAPPPPGIPGVEPDIRGATTLREMLAKHRNSDTCASCHQMIDPPGFALESFDPIGGWRDHFRRLGEGEKPAEIFAGAKKVSYKVGLPVDASGELPDGRPFAGFIEYRDLIAADKDLLAKAFLTKLLTFSTGREMGFSDRPEINTLVQKAAEKGYGVRDLILLTVSSEIFRRK
jgi:hypothetical protein